MKEFEIIGRYFATDSGSRSDVIKGVGDDCALLKIPEGQCLAVSMDTLIADVHFLAQMNAADIAHKAVAVNLSDLAACGAEPAWISLSVSMPQFDESWLSAFSQGLKRIIDFFGVQLIGGDTCRGPLSITIQAHGFVPESVFNARSGARIGELVCVTGSLGDAALGLMVAKQDLQVPPLIASQLLKKYYTPDPRIAAGIALRGRATSGIDISDGLLADLDHISSHSQAGILINWEAIPLSDAAKSIEDEALAMKAALSGGDDYELCFTVSEEDFDATRLALETVGTQCFPIGRVTEKTGIKLLRNKKEVELGHKGYQHF